MCRSPACEIAEESKIRIWRVVQVWLGFAWHFLNMLKKRPCFFNKPERLYSLPNIPILYRIADSFVGNMYAFFRKKKNPPGAHR